MNRRSAVRSGAVAVGILSLGGAGVLAAALPASAAPTCAATVPAATLISPTICEIRVTVDAEVTIPSSVAKVGAVLVGAGGGGYDNGPGDFGYAGDSGLMEYIEYAGDGVARDAVIGSAGVAGADDGPTSGEGGATLFGGAQADGGWSGEMTQALFGEGADPAGADVRDGYVLSELPGVDPALFPAGLDTFEYARGGTGDSSADGVPLTAGPTATDYGYGGMGLLDGGTSTPGVDGILILRFAAVDDVPVAPAAPSAPTLPDTGFDATPGVIAAGALLAVGGLAFAWGRRRRRSAD